MTGRSTMLWTIELPRRAPSWRSVLAESTTGRCGDVGGHSHGHRSQGPAPAGPAVRNRAGEGFSLARPPSLPGSAACRTTRFLLPRRPVARAATVRARPARGRRRRGTRGFSGAHAGAGAGHAAEHTRMRPPSPLVLHCNGSLGHCSSGSVLKDQLFVLMQPSLPLGALQNMAFHSGAGLPLPLLSRMPYRWVRMPGMCRLR